MRMRIRSVKPEFFLHEDLYDLEQETGLPIRVAWAGLWCAADREGRFKWRPRTLKAAILPHDDLDFSRVLDALTTRGFLVRYASQGAPEGESYGWIPSFGDHQSINNRESESALPDPRDCDVVSPACTRAARVGHASSTREVHALVEGKGREGKGREESATRAREAPPLPEPPPDLPLEPDPPKPEPPLRCRLAGCWDGADGMATPPGVLRTLGELEPRIVRLAADRSFVDPVTWFATVVDRFRADPKVRQRKLGLPILLGDLELWADPAPETPFAPADEEADRRERARWRQQLEAAEQMQADGGPVTQAEIDDLRRKLGITPEAAE